MKKFGILFLLLLTACTKAQPELRETKEVQSSIPYSDEELIESANNQIEDEAYYVDSITMQSDSEVWFSLKNKDLNKQYVFKYEGNELIPDRLVD
ncbi:MAG: hypothetical protein UDK37_01015 [Holdemanella biformis]|nr:hypothetical protein [Holdemanella biformis]MEE0472453.1 hypothetical protein [Holdemanella biformis]